MANFLNELTYKVASGAMIGSAQILNKASSNITKSVVGILLGQKKGGGARFYYKAGDGGIFNVMAKKIAGGALAYAKNEGIKALKSLINKKKALSGGDGKSQIQRLCDQANESDGANQIDKKKKYGVMPVNNGGNVVLALDFVGNWCPDAVMLGIPVDPPVSVSQSYVDDSNPFAVKNRLDSPNSFSSDTLVFYDVTALVTVQNERKLIITPVTGRDYSRKELMSNGDVTFTISGRINSNLPDVYPTKEVQKFIQIMQYRGPVKINSQLLAQYDIEKMVITGYSLPQKEGYRNIQEYTINCVGIQPLLDVQVASDTIISLNRVVTQEIDKKENKWTKLLNDTVNSFKENAVNTASDVGDTLIGKLLN